MKTAAKVFLIISIVTASFIVLTGIGGLIAGIGGGLAVTNLENIEFEEEIVINGEIQDPNEMDDQAAQAVGTLMIIVFSLVFGFYLIIGGVQLTVSSIGLKKLSSAKCASDISTAFKIIILLFGNLIAGILILCMKDKDFESPVATALPSSRIEDIAELKKLLDMGAITDEEFEAKKKQILGL